MSDPLHELCFPHIDFHPTLEGGEGGKKRKAEKEGGRESPLQTASEILWK